MGRHVQRLVVSMMGLCQLLLGMPSVTPGLIGLDKLRQRKTSSLADTAQVVSAGREFKV